MQFVRLMVLLVLLTLVAGCAGGSVDEVDGGVASSEDAAADLSDHPDANAAPDAADAADDADPCGVCCPGARTCLTETTVGVCQEDGSQHTEQPCGDGQICEAGSCVDEPVCEAGETRCHDGTTRLICRASQTSWRTQACEAGEACIDGDCVNGAPTGAECADDADCAGGKCRCGSGESCSPAPSRTYCTSTCTPGSCGPGEVCVASETFNSAGYDHCMPRCDQACSQRGLSCVSVPTRDSGELEFVQACTLDTAVDVGRKCTTAATCTGGTCLEGYFDFGLCTFACAGGCPDKTACVELDGTYYCSPLCGDGSPSDSNASCPLDPDGQYLDVDCPVRTTYDGSALRACTSN